MFASKAFSRRGFLRSLGATAGAMALPSVVSASGPGAGGRSAANERITVGCIGVGNQGRQVMQNFLADSRAQVVAVCDVKQRELDYARQFVDRHYRTSGCRAYADFRELIARDDIDAVLIATPDHWHVLCALAAARVGKDIYLEKPMGLSREEDQALGRAAGQYGTVFQFGTQQRSDPKFRLACELARNGRIGQLKSVHVWSPVSGSGGSTAPAAVPEGLDYDTWLGPAPRVPYTEHRCTNVFPDSPDPYKIWPFISDYSLGWVAGWGVHPLDIALWGAGDALAGAFEIEGAGRFPTSGACDTAVDWDLTVRYRTGAVLRFKGTPSADEWRARYGTRSDHGTAFEGQEGWVCVDRSQVSAEPDGMLRSAFGAGDVRLVRSVDHVGNFLDAIGCRGEPISPFSSALAVNTLCRVSSVAARVGRKLAWDDRAGKFVGDESADRLLSRAMRSPWRL